MDDSVSRCGAGAQAVEILKGAAVHGDPGGGQRFGRGVRTCESDDLMARADELGNDGGTDEAGSAGDKYTHEKTS